MCNTATMRVRERARATEACMPCAAHNGVMVAMVTRGCGQARPIATRQIYNIRSNWSARHSCSSICNQHGRCTRTPIARRTVFALQTKTLEKERDIGFGLIIPGTVKGGGDCSDWSRATADLI